MCRPNSCVLYSQRLSVGSTWLYIPSPVPTVDQSSLADAAGPALARAAPGFMVLQARVNVVGRFHVHRQRINFAQRQIVQDGRTSVRRHRKENPAVRARDHAVGIIGIDPERAKISKRPPERPDRLGLGQRGPGFAGVARRGQVSPVMKTSSGLPGLIRSLVEGVAGFPAEIGPGGAGLGPSAPPSSRCDTPRRRSTAPCPSLAGRRRVLALDCGCPQSRRGCRDFSGIGQSDAADSSGGKSAAELLPVRPAVRRLLNAAARAAVHEAATESRWHS